LPTGIVADTAGRRTSPAQNVMESRSGSPKSLVGGDSARLLGDPPHLLGVLSEHPSEGIEHLVVEASAPRSTRFWRCAETGWRPCAR
jgi:hypothetical protein